MLHNFVFIYMCIHNISYILTSSSYFYCMFYPVKEHIGFFLPILWHKCFNPDILPAHKNHLLENQNRTDERFFGRGGALKLNLRLSNSPPYKCLVTLTFIVESVEIEKNDYSCTHIYRRMVLFILM